jgi:UDP-glucose 4-epimerase
MKITVFGGGGFIGSTVANRLLQDGHQLRIFERPRIPAEYKIQADPAVEWISGDFLNRHDITAAISGVDAVLHLISTTLPKNSNDDPVYDVQSNLVSSLQLLEAMREQGVNKIIFISSGGTVYGSPVYLPIDENHPTDPHVSYGVTKLSIEKYLLMYQRLYGIRTIILRVANPYGERQRVETAQGAVGVFLSRAMAGRPLDIWGDGNIVRDYIYCGDVAEAFVCALAYRGEYSVFNISAGQGLSLNDLIEKIQKLLGNKVYCNYHPGRPFDIPISILDNKRAFTELDWTPHSTDEVGGKALH